VATLKPRAGGDAFDVPRRCVVGRAPGCDLVLQHGGVSGQHAMVRWNGLSWLVRDLGSTNGTTLDGRRLVPGMDEELGDGGVLRFGGEGRGWTVTSLEPPEGSLALPSTSGGAGGPVRLVDAELEFRVSRDEERCECLVRMGPRVETLGARSHHYTLLTLARRRLADAEAGDVGPDEHGWVYSDDLADMLGIDPNVVNVHIHRGRRQLAEAGIADPGQLVERRPGPQVRLGTGRVTVHRSG